MLKELLTIMWAHPDMELSISQTDEIRDYMRIKITKGSYPDVKRITRVIPMDCMESIPDEGLMEFIKNMIADLDSSGS